jgi:UDP-N-acetylglucosamine 2-epimerase
MRIVSVVGTRPQLIKAAALTPVLRRDHDEILVDTGQHYDDDLAGEHLSSLGLGRPERSLGIGSGAAAEQTARMIGAIAAAIEAEGPDVVLVYGDTNSTLAGAIAALKSDVPVAHVEAGLRSFDRAMPEETNRVIADHVARWRFAPTPTAVRNLAAEGIVDGVTLVGDVMQDLASATVAGIRDPGVLETIGERLAGATGRPIRLAPGTYLFATVHRAENRRPDAIRSWTAALSRVATHERPVVLALHPGTRAAIEAAGASLTDAVVVAGPQGYRTSLALQLHAAAVLTDSGGVQREAAWLGVPCLVLRGTTEWTEAVAGSDGRMVVVGVDPDRIAAELARVAGPLGAREAAARRAATARIEPAGAAERISAMLAQGAP